MKSAAAPVLIALFLAFCTWESFTLYREEHAKNERLLTNIRTARDSCIYFVARDGQKAARIQAQEFTIKEIRAALPHVIQAAKNLYIPPRLIQGYTTATTQGVIEVKTVLHDTILIQRDTIRARAISYQAPFYAVKGYFRKDSAFLKITSTDTLTILQARGRRVHPLAWIFSKRLPDETIIKNSNPDNKIILKESIKIKP